MGEDCALVLEGKLSYFITNMETIQVEPGELVFGWKSVIHGYLNEQSQSLHLLVFVTPSKIGLSYPTDDDPTIQKLSTHHRKIDPHYQGLVQSEFSTFTFITIYGIYQEEKEKGILKVFVDWEIKEIYVFENEDVLLEMTGKKRLLKYTAHL